MEAAPLWWMVALAGAACSLALVAALVVGLLLYLTRRDRRPPDRE